MKQIFSFIMMIWVFNKIQGQQASSDTSRTCLEVAKEVSYYWKLDSLANNGFRLCASQKFLKCKPDKIYADVLLTKLGKPNEVRKTFKGTQYLYYCFDIRKMPRGFDAPSAIWYISFKFEGEGDIDYLTSIEEGDRDIFQ